MWPIDGGDPAASARIPWSAAGGTADAPKTGMDEILPTEQGCVRPDISDLTPGEAWSPVTRPDEEPDPERPETD